MGQVNNFDGKEKVTTQKTLSGGVSVGVVARISQNFSCGGDRPDIPHCEPPLILRNFSVQLPDMTPHANNPVQAVLLMCLATAFIAATMLLAKSLGTDTLGDPLHPFQITFGRFAFALLTISTVVAIRRPKFSRPHWGLHVGRTVLGAIGVTLMFASVSYILLADATAISFLNPVFGMIFAIPFLGEKIGKWRWGSAALALFGALVLLRPGSGVVQFGALLALGAAVVLGMELIFIKLLSRREPPLQILFVNNSIGLVIIAIAASFFWQPPSLEQWSAMAALGVLMAGAQACFVNAMARADASLVTPFSYLTLVFAVIYDFALFGVFPDWISWIGAGVILLSAAVLAWRETRH